MANIIRFGGGSGGKKDENLPITRLTEGTIIKINESGVPQDYYLAQIGYQPELNQNRVLLVRKKCPKVGTWNDAGTNNYAGSTIDTFFNSEMKAMYDANVRVAMGETVIPYTAGNGNTAVTTLSRSVFALSLTELGITYAYANVEGEAVPIASLLQTPTMEDGSLDGQWVRSPNKNNSTQALYVIAASGSVSTFATTGSTGYRPCFTLPNTATVLPEPNLDGSYTLAIDAEDVAMAAEASIMRLNNENGVYTEALNELGVETE